MSADSRAMSAPVSTEIPTSALAQCGGVVDAVAEIADRVTATLEGRDDAGLLGRCQLGEERDPFGRLLELGVGHRLDRTAEQQPRGIQADVPAHLAGDQLVVAGEDLDRDAVGAEGGDRRGGRLLGRVEEGDESAQDHVVFVGHAVLPAGQAVHLLASDRDHAQAVSRSSRC